jgi:glucose-1-phosphate cytidylyltransferase
LILKVVILAGGLGTRLANETTPTPKPMVEIGGRPILWHIMQHYAHYGHSEFLVCLGYRGDVVKRYFFEYAQFGGDVTVSTATGGIEVHDGPREQWTVHLIDTGPTTDTGGRVKRMKDWLDDDHFLLTYGDGVSNVDLDALVRFHGSHGRLATVTAVRPPARFGGLELEGDRVSEFSEKRMSEGWINGGFMVLSSAVLDQISGDDASLELDLLESLAQHGELAAFRHDGFWQCMDTPRDVRLLSHLWESGDPPWKTW